MTLHANQQRRRVMTPKQAALFIALLVFLWVLYWLLKPKRP